MVSALIESTKKLEFSKLTPVIRTGYFSWLPSGHCGEGIPLNPKALTLGGLAVESAEGENNFIQLVSADRDAKIAGSSAEFELKLT